MREKERTTLYLRELMGKAQRGEERGGSLPQVTDESDRAAIATSCRPDSP